MRDAVAEETVLLADDFAATLRIVCARCCSDFTSQFARLQLARKGTPAPRACCAAARGRRAAVLTSTRGSVSRVQFERPAAVGRRRASGCRGSAAAPARRRRCAPGFGSSRRELGHHVGEVVGIDAAQRHQPPHIAPRQQVEIVEQRCHRRIEPVALGQLRREALPAGRGRTCRPGRSASCARAPPRPAPASTPIACAIAAGWRRQPAGRRRAGRSGARRSAGRAVVRSQPELLAQMLARGCARRSAMSSMPRSSSSEIRRRRHGPIGTPSAAPPGVVRLRHARHRAAPRSGLAQRRRR